MRVCVFGLWHLGTVIASCLASGGHDVVGLDFDGEVVDGLNGGKPPLFEPGLEDLLRRGLASGRLRFSTDPATVLPDSDVVWVAYDTPVDEEDRADVEYVVKRVESIFPQLPGNILVLISSQLPAGTTLRLEQSFARKQSGRNVTFAYSPENLRLGEAIAAFSAPDRVVVGIRSPADRDRIAALLQPFTARIEWMSVESAEMTKHALNALLATSVTFINEIAGLCEQVGADAGEVERGLRTDSRIGPKAYLRPGAAFAGGTLARDVMFLTELGRKHRQLTTLISAVKESNEEHKHWAERRLQQVLGDLDGRTIAVWGLTYKPGTDTLRRSSAIQLCRSLLNQRAIVRAHDPVVRHLPADFAGRCCSLAAGALDALEDASALVISTGWPEYRQVAADEVAKRMKQPLALDAGRFLADTLGRDPRIRYLSVGRGTT